MSSGIFVNYGSRLTEAPPVYCQKVAQYVFLIPVDAIGWIALHDLCRRAFYDVTFDASTNNAFVTCAPAAYEDTSGQEQHRLILQFNIIGWVGGDLKVGTAETEVLIHVPVTYSIDGHDAGGAFFTPYMWVNNSPALVSGREVYGYAKAFAKTTIDLDPTDHHLKSANVNTLSVLKSDTMEPADILNVTETPNVHSVNELTQVLKQFSSGRFDMPPFVKLVGTWLTTGNVTQLFLKQ